MIVRRLADVSGSDAEVSAETWTSRRLLLRRDGMGFSLHDTVIRPGTATRMWYRHHVEAVYCIEGTGSVEVLATGERFSIEPGTVYALDGNEEHILRADAELRMVCVFRPALTGRETHGEDGAYPPSDAMEARENAPANGGANGDPDRP